MLPLVNQALNLQVGVVYVQTVKPITKTAVMEHLKLKELVKFKNTTKEK